MELHCHKNRYPFRLAAPSFIFPADYITNASRLAPYLDEVELLFFESGPESLPSHAEVEQLRTLQEKMNIGYNLHLPLDLDLCVDDADSREAVVASFGRVFDLVSPLSATTYTLHLPMKDVDATYGSQALKIWQDRAMRGLDALFRRVNIPPRKISVETLDFPPDWLGPVVEGMGLSVCVDIGHVVRYGYDLASVFRQFQSRITICHLHGVADGEDHLALQHMDAAHLRTVQQFLTGFTETVSLEVFSGQKLNESMQALSLLMQKTEPPDERKP